MAKEVLKVFSVWLLVILALVAVNISILYVSNLSEPSITGQSILDDTKDIYDSMSLSSKIFLLVQFLALFAVLIYFIVKTRKAIKEREEIANMNIIKNPGRSKTDLDTLYSILLEKKKIRVPTIAKAFKVSNDVAMEWCRILEIGELAIISYPGFIGEPSVKLSEKPKEGEEETTKKLEIKPEQKAPEAEKQPAQAAKPEAKPAPVQPAPFLSPEEQKKKDMAWAQEAVNKGLTKAEAKALLKGMNKQKAKELLGYYTQIKQQKETQEREIRRQKQEQERQVKIQEQEAERAKIAEQAKREEAMRELEKVKQASEPPAPPAPPAPLKPVKQSVEQKSQVQLSPRDIAWAQEAFDKKLERAEAMNLLKGINPEKAKAILAHYDKLKGGR